jgi:hypothetical protein
MMCGGSGKLRKPGRISSRRWPIVPGVSAIIRHLSWIAETMRRALAFPAFAR